MLVRVRPLIREELDPSKAASKSSQVCTKCHEDCQRLFLVKPFYDDREFSFDTVIPPSASQADSYTKAAETIVSAVTDGYNGTIMAYGQTGSGKTFTVFGSRKAIEFIGGRNTHEEAGIVQRAVDQIFQFIKENIDEAQFQIRVSFLQIYMETIADLLASSQPPGGLQIREDPRSGIFVNGLTQALIRNPAELLTLIHEAAKLRSTGATAMNKSSSRSHAILQLFLEQRWIEAESTEDVKRRRVKRGLLTLVDLAGSERLSKSGSEGVRLSEAKNINKSIAALGNCISALASHGSIAHVPFRDSKLTRILTDSLGGNSKTCIYACVGPTLTNYDETFSTLLFATRAMKVRTFVQLNEKVDVKAGDLSGTGLIERNAVLESQISSMRQEAENLRTRLAGRSQSPVTSQGLETTQSQNMSTLTGLSAEDAEDKSDARERHLVSKFSHIIQHLQAELARKNIEIAQLKSAREGRLDFSPVREFRGGYTTRQ